MTDRETRTALPSTPAVVHRGWVKPRPQRSRLEYVIWATAVVFGSTIGGTLALRAEPAPANARVVWQASPAAGAASGSGGRTAAPSPPGDTAANLAGTGPAPAKAVVVWQANPGAGAASGSAGSAAAPSPPGGAASTPAGAMTVQTAATAARAAASGPIGDALRRFVSWSHSHAGARCPDAAALAAQPDPWGHALRVTCTDQPADQIAGVVSAGPDGVAGTRDDIESWTLGDAVTELIRGPRWHSSRSGRRIGGGTAASADAPSPAAAPATTTSLKKPPASPGAGSSDNDGDGIPDRR